MEKDLLLELGTEEIPARFISSTKKSMKSFLEKKLKELRISFDTINIKSTPRRFSIFINKLSDKQTESVEEIKGPSRKIAFDENNNPSKALSGFLKSKNVSIDDIRFVKNGNEEYVYVQKKLESLKTESYFKEIFEQMIDSLSFPKPMRWGGNKIKFIRPIRWILCLYGNEVPELEMFNLKASNLTRGHRFLGKSYIEVPSIEEYEKILEENYVILDDEKRRELIRNQIEKVAEDLNSTYMEDEDLLEEINYIVEYPTALYGQFKEEYLKLPKETIITPMKEHQRYFPVLDKNGNLVNKFITVRNGDGYMIENVRKGNEKVLDARLSDAKFFYEQDSSKKLEEYVERLNTIVYHEKLGTMYDKMKRLQSISKSFAKLLNADESDAQRAAYLCKADLTTSMVFEFTELQGIMGYYYANISGEKKEISDAIVEHYLPRFSGDEVAKSKLGIVLSLTDKFDTLAGFFAVGIKPTGSQDPYALRRTALGILNTLIENKLLLSTEELIKSALNEYKDKIEFNFEEVYLEILDFMKLRLKNILLDKKIRYDVVDAVIDDISTVYKTFEKAVQLEKWLSNPDNITNLNTFIRVYNISKETETDKKIDIQLFNQNEEKQVYSNYLNILPIVKNLNSELKYVESLDELSSMTQDINDFFDNVMIMVEDAKIRDNRLLLVNVLKEMIFEIADFSKIVI